MGPQKNCCLVGQPATSVYSLQGFGPVVVDAPSYICRLCAIDQMYRARNDSRYPTCVVYYTKQREALTCVATVRMFWRRHTVRWILTPGHSRLPTEKLDGRPNHASSK